jgi:hypothetical protein
VIFTTSPDATFASFRPDSIPYKDSRLVIYFETEEMMEETMILLRFNCPEPTCDYIAAAGWGDLKLHVRATHGRQLWYVLQYPKYHKQELSISVAICAFDTRKSSRMSMRYTLLHYWQLINHPCLLLVVVATAHDLQFRLSKSKAVCIRFASSVVNVSSARMSCILI